MAAAANPRSILTPLSIAASAWQSHGSVRPWGFQMPHPVGREPRADGSGVMAMTRPAVLAVVGLAASLVVALTGCSTGDRVDLGDDSSGNLVAAIAGEPDQLDPQKTSAYFSFEVLENVFDTLVQPDANLAMRPALAESWTVSPDQLAWTFHLRHGVTFHDGSPFTADDVVYSYRRIIDQKLANSDKLRAVSGIAD